MLKSGVRLRSQVCETQVIVVKATEALGDLQCGGAPMVALDAKSDAVTALNPNMASGNVMGKRYVDQTGGEILVTKAGEGTLSAGADPLKLKEAKPLPASD